MHYISLWLTCDWDIEGKISCANTAQPYMIVPKWLACAFKHLYSFAGCKLLSLLKSSGNNLAQHGRDDKRTWAQHGKNYEIILKRSNFVSKKGWNDIKKIVEKRGKDKEY